MFDEKGSVGAAFWQKMQELRGFFSYSETNINVILVALINLRFAAEAEGLPGSFLRIVEEAQTLPPNQPEPAYGRVSPMIVAQSCGVIRELTPQHADLFVSLTKWLASLDLDDDAIRQQTTTLVMKLNRASARTGYYTPFTLARFAVELLAPKPTDRIFDPYVGEGTFLTAAWHYLQHGDSVPGPVLHGLETNEPSLLMTSASLLLAGADATHLRFGSAIDVSMWPNSGIDLIFANPPINAHMARNQDVTQTLPIKTTDITGICIQQILQMLAPEGRAVVLVPEGFLFRGGKEQELRRYLLENGHVEAVVSLPPGVLPATAIKTSFVLLRKTPGQSVVFADATGTFQQRSARSLALLAHEKAVQFAATLRDAIRSANDRSIGWEKVQRAELAGFAAKNWNMQVPRVALSALDQFVATAVATLKRRRFISVHLGDLVTVFNGHSIKEDKLFDAGPGAKAGYVRIADLNGKHITRPKSWVYLVNVEPEWLLAIDDILLSRTGAKVALVQDVSVARIASAGVLTLRVKDNRVRPAYLAAYLASSAVKQWLKATEHGTLINRLSQSDLLKCPVLIPDLELQNAVEQEFLKSGTDAVTYLGSVIGPSSSAVFDWLITLEASCPIPPDVDRKETLGRFVQLAPLAEMVLDLGDSAIATDVPIWLSSLQVGIRDLSALAQNPPGPAFLFMLMSAARNLEAVVLQATSASPNDVWAKVVAARLLDWNRQASAELAQNELRVVSSPHFAVKDSTSEIAVQIQNHGALPLRDLHVQSDPNWGAATYTYVPEGSTVDFKLHGQVAGSELCWQLNWTALTLLGESVRGTATVCVPIIADAGLNTDVELGVSPYVTGSPLKPTDTERVFFGRDELIAQIVRHISAHGNVVLLEGNRRAGKTSILKHIEGAKTIPGWLAVYCSLQAADSASPIDGVAPKSGVPTVEFFRLMAMAKCIAEAMIPLGIVVPLPNETTLIPGQPRLGLVSRACKLGISAERPFDDFRNYLEVVIAVLAEVGMKLLVMLDEFDKLQEGIDNGVTAPQVPENLRFLIQSYPGFSAILTGSRRLKRLREEYWSALYGLGKSFSVTSLDRDAARRVVVEPTAGRLHFHKEAIARATALTGYQPFLLQCLCNNIFDSAVRYGKRDILLSTVEDEGTKLVRNNEHFASLWDYAGRTASHIGSLSQLILLRLAFANKQNRPMSFSLLKEELAQSDILIDDVVLETHLAGLRELEIVAFTGDLAAGRYRLEIPLMADWIRQQQDSDVVLRRARREMENQDD